MKKALLSISIVAIMASCSDRKAADTAQLPAPDTAGLAAFNSWKDQQAAFEMAGVQDVQEQYADAEAEEVKPVTKVIYREAPVQQQKAAVKPRTVSKAPTTVSTTPQREVITRNDVPAQSPAESTGSGEGVSTGTSEGTGDVATAPQPAKKEGWSKAAQGAAIGGASGAVVGAIISKNKKAGAVIGGVVGAAGGYVLGRSKDKKDGRY